MMKRHHLVSALAVGFTIGFAPLGFTIGFALMKLTGAVDWSWWIVVAPIWSTPLGFAVLALQLPIFAGTSDQLRRRPSEAETENQRSSRDDRSVGLGYSLGRTAHLAIMQYFARDRISFSEALALVFITLRLTGHIAWSWWLVLLPLYVWFVLTVALEATMKTLANCMIRREQRAAASTEVPMSNDRHGRQAPSPTTIAAEEDE